MVGVIVSVFSIGPTLTAMNRGYESFQQTAGGEVDLAERAAGGRAERRRVSARLVHADAVGSEDEGHGR